MKLFVFIMSILAGGLLIGLAVLNVLDMIKARKHRSHRIKDKGD